MKRILISLFALMLVFTALPALAQDEELGTIPDVAADANMEDNDYSLSTLLTAVEAADLVETLSDTEVEFTVFAPTNGAFETLLTDMQMGGDDFLANADYLASVLTYHVVPGSLTIEELQSMAAERNDGLVTLTTVNGAEIDLTIGDTDSFSINDGEAISVDTDIFASNGVIHVIDNVLVPMDEMLDDMSDDMAEDDMMDDMPGTIVEVAVANEELSTLVAAVTAADLVDTLSDADAEFTVFAPTNGAFDTYLTEHGMSSEDLLTDPALLGSILTYHVVEGTVYSGDLTGMAMETEDGTITLTTVNGADLTINVDDLVTINDGEASVTAVDYPASNGVIHIIDNVLIPDVEDAIDDEAMSEEMSDDTAMTEESSEFNVEDGTITAIVAANPNFSILLTAIDTAELGETLATGEYTVFAPSNQAFANLLSTTDMTAEELLSSDLLSDILMYHVVVGTVTAEDVVALNGETVATALTGNNIGIAVNDGGTVILNGVVDVTETDITATNGVIHVIDDVLLPGSALEAFGLLPAEG